MRLNEKTIKELTPPDRANRIHYDSEVPGFGVRITNADARAFVLNYVIHGRERRLTIGSWPSWSATAARARAKELRREIDQGVDPLQDKQEARAASTFAEVAREYLELYAVKKKSGFRDAEYLRRDVLPHWGNRKASAIRKSDVLELIERKAKYAPTSANRLLACISKVFNWAIYERKDALDTTNPCNKLPAPGGKEKPRERYLEEGEIATFWEGLDSARMSDEVKTALRLILVTSQRPGEVCQIELADLNGDWWTVPGAKAKNGLSHRVPLSELARELLGSRGKPARWLFPSPRGSAPIQVNALSRALRNNGHFGFEKFTAHDLRRTAASYLGRLDVPRFIIGRVLNHVDREITGTYDRYSYDREKRRALERWDRKLRVIIGEAAESKVVEISR
jgi:integrase